MRLRRQLKLATISLAVALLAIVVGVSTTLWWQRTRILPYCEVARNAERYHGQIITVKTRLIFGSQAMYVFEDCDPISALASLVELDERSTRPATLSYVEEVLVSGNQYSSQQADAIITGRFNGEFSRGCWGPAFQIAASKIELVSPITEYAPGPASDTPMRTRH